MNKNFKPGDLALIVQCSVAEMIGKCVELIERVPPGDTSLAVGGPWFNDSERVSWIVEGDGLVSRYFDESIRPSLRSLIPEKWLMPLRGDFQPEQQKSREAANG